MHEEDIQKMYNYMNAIDGNFVSSVQSQKRKNHGKSLSRTPSVDFREISETFDTLRTAFQSFTSCVRELTTRSNTIVLIVAFFFFVACLSYDRCSEKDT